jgi:transcriptional regulator with XRE-family HTH domain
MSNDNLINNSTVSGRQLQALRQHHGLTQEELAQRLGFKDRGVVHRLEKEKAVPVKILANVMEIFNLSSQELEELLYQLEPIIDYEGDVENNENNEVKQSKGEKVDAKIQGFLYNSFEQNAKNRDSELNRMASKNESLLRQLQESDNKFFTLLQEFNNLKHDIDLRQIKNEQMLRQQDTELKEYVRQYFEREFESLDRQITEQVTEIIKTNAVESKGLGDKFIEVLPNLQPLISSVSDLLATRLTKVFPSGLGDKVAPVHEEYYGTSADDLHEPPHATNTYNEATQNLNNEI